MIRFDNLKFLLMNSPFPIYKLPGNYMAFCNMQRNTKAHLVKISK